MWDKDPGGLLALSKLNTVLAATLGIQPKLHEVLLVAIYGERKEN